MFKEAKEGLLERPWAVDRLDALLERFADVSKGPHKKALIFVDNAGSDVILGILPLARELVQRGTTVVRPPVDTLHVLQACRTTACSGTHCACAWRKPRSHSVHKRTFAWTSVARTAAIAVRSI